MLRDRWSVTWKNNNISTTVVNIIKQKGLWKELGIIMQIQSEAKVGLKLFVWKIIQLINSNTKINWSCTHNCKPTFAPPCMHHCVGKWDCELFLNVCLYYCWPLLKNHGDLALKVL